METYAYTRLDPESISHRLAHENQLKHTVNQPINQSINQSIIQSIKKPKRCSFSLLHIISICSIIINVTLLLFLVLHLERWKAVQFQPVSQSVNQSINHSVHHLNHQRWAKVLHKLATGHQITIGFHGGSITRAKPGYPDQLISLLTHSFPINQSLYINDSHAYRLNGQLSHRAVIRGAPAMPSDAASLCVSEAFQDELIDVMSFEFAVNDAMSSSAFLSKSQTSGEKSEDQNSSDPASAFSPTDNIERFAQTYLRQLNGPAIMLPLFSFQREGVQFRNFTEGAEQMHKKAALHYGIPFVSWADEFVFDWRTNMHVYQSRYHAPNLYQHQEPIHPNSNGHLIMAQLLHSMIQQMYNSLIASNYETLLYSSLVPFTEMNRQSLLDSPASPLPSLLNPAVKWTCSSTSFCRLMFPTYWKHSNQPDLNEFIFVNVYDLDGIQWHPGHHDEKPVFRPTNHSAINQTITFQSPVPFTHIAILFVFRTWNTTWANASVHLESSSGRAECRTEDVQFSSTWASPTTQTTAITIWSINQSFNPPIDLSIHTDESCVRDLMKITKISPGDLRIAGFYSN